MSVFVLKISLVCCLLTVTAFAQDVNFDRQRDGTYSRKRIQRDWPGVRSAQGYDRMKVTSAKPFAGRNGKCLTVRYPKGAVGPGKGGGQFVVPLAPKEEYYLSYWVYFDKSFDFKRGGKLPGLTSGGAGASGGKYKKGYNWSARFNFMTGGGLAVYLYHVDKKTRWGEIVDVRKRFRPGTWHHIVQHVKLNHGNSKDGVLEVWFDGKKALTRKRIRFRLGKNGMVDTLFFSTFHGGAGAKYAPQTNSLACFDDFRICTTEKEALSTKTRRGWP